ncbi:MAG: single-stranded DNA-binding protein [Bacilli bacterium]|nr:single-stranded DNA-binding protein [Bacilli bacterium]
MLNQVILVGRLVRTPELILTESGKKKSLITLAVSRSYKNQNGEYDTDFLDCTLWTGVAESTSEYCKTGDVIGVKGRLQTRLLESEEGIKYKKVEVIADRVTFLSSSKSETIQEEFIEEDNGEETTDEDKKKDKKKK